MVGRARISTRTATRFPYTRRCRWVAVGNGNGVTRDTCVARGVSNGVGWANATAVGVGNAIADDVAEYGSALGNYNSVNARGTALGNFNEVYGVGASAIGDNNLARSEERRGGKECVSTCRSGWSP